MHFWNYYYYNYIRILQKKALDETNNLTAKENRSKYYYYNYY